MTFDTFDLGSAANDEPVQQRIVDNRPGSSTPPPPAEHVLTDEERKILEILMDVTLSEAEKSRKIFAEQNRSSIVHPAAKLNPDTGWYEFPGIDGIPYRNRSGMVPHFKSDDPEYKKPHKVLETYADVFCLPQDKERYSEILKKVSRGAATVSREEFQYDPESKSFVVFLRWGEYYLEG